MRPLTTASVIAAGALSACAPLNQGTTIGGQVKLKSFAGGSEPTSDFSSPPPTVSLSARPEVILADEPTSLSLDRATWRTSRILVPVDGTRHYTAYGSGNDPYYTDSTARQRGEMPSGVSALDLSGDSDTDQILEALASPLSNAWDLALLPYRMVRCAPWHIDTSRNATYDRYTPALRSARRTAETQP